MTDPERPPSTFSSPARIVKDHEPLERALKETEDRWIDDFTRRLNGAIADVARKN